jgi:predicted TIM-barrel fold metal-dependent hydrolase
VAKLFDVAAAHGCAIFAQCGYLTIEMRAKLGLRTAVDVRFGDPLALAVTAGGFPNVPVIVPHFGGGFFREALMAAESCPNMLFDTSSSNSWVRFEPALTLTEVFRRALAVVGPDRLLFGTDSSFFPRGWRRVIHGAQQAILHELGAEPDVCGKIFGGNFDRIFGK